MKKLTKKQMIQFWDEVENEGLGYWCQNYGSDFKGTEIEPLVKQARDALNALEKILSKCEDAALEDGE